MLPRKRPKPAKQDGRWRSPAHRKHVSSHYCSIEECHILPVHAHHIKNGTDGGMGMKCSDWFCISLCAPHHDEIHRGEESFVAKYGVDLHRLALGFCQTSPKRAEIAKAKAERIWNG